MILGGRPSDAGWSQSRRSPSAPLAEWQQVLIAMRDNGYEGIEVNDDDIQLCTKMTRSLQKN